MAEVSTEFRNAICHTTSREVQCSHCTRTHFCDSRGEWNDGEGEGRLAALLAAAAELPDQYVVHHDTIAWASFLVPYLVFDCPCGFAAYIEEEIWHSRRVISRYLFDRCAAERRLAEQAHELAIEAKAAVERGQ